MATTQTRLITLIETKNMIKQKLIDLGVDVTPETPFDEYPSLIKQLGVGDDIEETTTDQELLQLIDLYKWLSTNDYEYYEYTDEEIQAIHAVLDNINAGEKISEDKPEVDGSPKLVVTRYGRTTYYVGNTFDLSGYVINAVYSDGSVVNVSDRCVASPSGKLTANDTVIKISCVIDGVTLSFDQPVYYIKLLQYVESTGSQYVNTIMLAPNISRIDMDFEVKEVTGSWATICYTENNKSPWQGFGLRVNTSKMLSFSNGDSAGVAPVTAEVGTRYKAECRYSEGTVVLNGISYSIGTGTIINNNLYMFASNQAGSVVQYGKIRLYRFKLYDKNGKLVRDYAPCEDKAGVICLRDLVSESYVYASGSGTLVGGPVAY
jgi:hypothetical protein